MKTAEVVRLLELAIEDLKRVSGKSTIETPIVQKWLQQIAQWDRDDHLKPDRMKAGEAQMETYRAELMARIERQKQGHEIAIEMHRSAVAAGQTAVRTLLTINGGAAVALLALVGHLAGSATPVALSIPTVARAIAPFVVGVFAAGTQVGAVYVSQYLYADGHLRWGHVFNGLAVSGGIAALISFAYGSRLAFVALT